MMYLLDYPMQIGLFITNQCNFSCAYCIVDAQETRTSQELSEKEIIALLDAAKAAGVQRIDFSGGEPLCRHDFREICQYAVEKNFAISLVTNGSLLDKKTACFFREVNGRNPLRIRVSLDAAHKELNDTYRFSGSYAAAMQALDNLQEQGILPELSTVVHRQNYNYFEEILELMQARAIKVIHVNPIMSIGRAKDLRDLFLPLAEFKKLMQQKKQWEKAYGITIKADTPLDFLVNPEKDADIIQRCLLGYFFLGVHANGDIYPCPNMMDTILGNIREDDIFTLWKEAPFLKVIRDTDLLKEECADCRYKIRCGGGCRALAWQERGDYLCPDPYCWIANRVE